MNVWETLGKLVTKNDPEQDAKRKKKTGPKLLVGPKTMAMSEQNMHEIGAQISHEATISIEGKDGLLTTLANGISVGAFCEGQTQIADHNGPIWADMRGTTLFELPDDLASEHIHHVIVFTTQQYEGRDFGRDDDLEYIGKQTKTITVPDDQVASIIEVGSQDLGSTGGGTAWYKNPHNRQYDENGNTIFRGLSAWDGEAAILHSLHPDGTGTLPDHVWDIINSEHPEASGFAPVAGGVPKETGDIYVHTSSTISEKDIREAVATAEAAIVANLERSSRTPSDKEPEQDTTEMGDKEIKD